MSEEKAGYDAGASKAKERPWHCKCGEVIGMSIRRNKIRALRIISDDYTIVLYSGDVICHKCGESSEFWPGEEYVNALIERRRRLARLVDEL